MIQYLLSLPMVRYERRSTVVGWDVPMAALQISCLEQFKATRVSPRHVTTVCKLLGVETQWFDYIGTAYITGNVIHAEGYPFSHQYTPQVLATHSSWRVYDAVRLSHTGNDTLLVSCQSGHRPWSM